ncbi:nucleotidyl transferase AbiEii/AbiGii toxin family protein [Fodinisporobacter ferrooxydans]|uniref:nucleotidyl transferase AbiEii/AbiGii toxin family protein n=1 Tax=Fodinisporobacter ferrooxydans TaxID=2901836 RepID=UPI0032427E77
MVLLSYLQERLLYRLSISEFREKFVLKGGLFLFSLTQFKARPTKDIDFLARQIANDTEFIKAAFEKICNLTVEEDGVKYNAASMTVERIKEDTDYEGVRIKISAFLGRMKKYCSWISDLGMSLFQSRRILIILYCYIWRHPIFRHIQLNLS